MKLLLAGVALLALSSCNFMDSEMTKVCEAVIKDRLRSPSGYKRVEISTDDRVLSADEWLKMEMEDIARALEATKETRTKIAKLVAEQIRNGQDEPYRLITKYISYDAPNAYGTEIRGIAICTHVAQGATESDASELFVKVDGKTSTEWLVDQVKASRD